jgi:hypothetical protein
LPAEPCGTCGGDGTISNSWGQTNRCPNCRGTGRRAEQDSLIRDVTKTKPSHHKGQNKAEPAKKQTWPSTFEGGQLANEVQASASCTTDTKARLIREIIEYEGSHGRCTQTFIKKVRKQVRPRQE